MALRCDPTGGLVSTYVEIRSQHTHACGRVQLRKSEVSAHPGSQSGERGAGTDAMSVGPPWLSKRPGSPQIKMRIAGCHSSSNPVQSQPLHQPGGLRPLLADELHGVVKLT